LKNHENTAVGKKKKRQAAWLFAANDIDGGMAAAAAQKQHWQQGGPHMHSGHGRVKRQQPLPPPPGPATPPPAGSPPAGDVPVTPNIENSTIVNGCPTYNLVCKLPDAEKANLVTLMINGEATKIVSAVGVAKLSILCGAGDGYFSVLDLTKPITLVECIKPPKPAGRR